MLFSNFAIPAMSHFYKVWAHKYETYAFEVYTKENLNNCDIHRVVHAISRPIHLAIKYTHICQDYFTSTRAVQWPLLLTWFNFNPSMDK